MGSRKKNQTPLDNQSLRAVVSESGKNTEASEEHFKECYNAGSPLSIENWGSPRLWKEAIDGLMYTKTFLQKGKQPCPPTEEVATDTIT